MSKLRYSSLAKPPPAFSLIELLVAMAVITLLATIVIQSLGTIRNRSDRVQSTNRLRTLYLAISAFANEHHGLLPTNGVSEDPDIPEDTAKRWNLQLAAYIDSSFRAESKHASQHFRPPWMEYDDNGMKRTNAVGTYGYNFYLSGKFGNVSIAQITNPARFPLMGESAPPVGGLRMLPDGPHPNAVKHGYSGPTSNFGPAPGPDGRSGFLFADGHIEVNDISNPSAWPWKDRSIFDPFK